MGKGSFIHRTRGLRLCGVTLNGVTLCGLALVATSACSLHPGQVRADELAVERARATDAERHAQALEARLSRLEAELARQSERDASEQRANDQTNAKLDRLIAAQEQLVLRLEPPQPPPTAGPPAATPTPASTVDPALRAYLEDLLTRAQSGAPPWRGGLSPEKRDALRVLLDSQRHVELGNPMAL